MWMKTKREKGVTLIKREMENVSENRNKEETGEDNQERRSKENGCSRNEAQIYAK